MLRVTQRAALLIKRQRGQIGIIHKYNWAGPIMSEFAHGVISSRAMFSGTTRISEKAPYIPDLHTFPMFLRPNSVR